MQLSRAGKRKMPPLKNEEQKRHQQQHALFVLVIVFNQQLFSPLGEYGLYACALG